MLNKKISPILGIAIIILLTGVVIGAFFLLRDTDEIIIVDEKTVPDKVDEEDVNDWIIRKRMITPQQEELIYRFEIDEQTSLLFIKKEKAGTDWKGDIILMQNGKESVIRENTEIYSPGGFSYSVYLTNSPDILILENMFFFVWQDYLDINKGEYVASVCYKRDSFLDINQPGKEEVKITFDMESCDPQIVPEGKQVELRGILVNGNVAYRFEEPIPLTCVDPGGLGPIYDPEPIIEEVLLDNTFSKVSFLVRVEEWKEPIILSLPEVIVDENGGEPTLACGDNVTFTYRGETVTYGTVESNGKCWMDRNLGASRVATAYNDSQAYGDLFQWGRLDDGHQTRTSGTTKTLSSTDDPGHSNFIYGMDSPYDWRSPQNNNLWQGDGAINDPCPLGWRVPSYSEWDAERASWSFQNYNGAFASPLKLTVAGTRFYGGATLGGVGSSGNYWSSTVSGSGAGAFYLRFKSNAYVGSHSRAGSVSVRCIKD
ncbi:MAG: FISUMP domain-containing protein [bacterium]|nr:FISUMP domain-containing protein [bacterium]